LSAADVEADSIESVRHAESRLELSRVNQRALNDGLAVPRHPSHACAAPIGRIEFILRFDLLAQVRPFAAVQEKSVDLTPADVHEHHAVDLVFGHIGDNIPATSAEQAGAAS
jgi:hypothetical protein